MNAPTTAGKLKWTAAMAVWLVNPPSSVTIALDFWIYSVMSASVNLATMISPSSNFSSSSFLVDARQTLPETDLVPIPVPDVIISPIVWTLIRFEVPDIPNGIPAVTIVISPSATNPSLIAPKIALSISSSVSCASWITIGYTPQTTESWRATLSVVVAAIVFVCGLNLEIILDVLPLDVQEIIALASNSFAMSQVFLAIAFVVVFDAEISVS